MSDIKITKGSTYRDVLFWATEECVFKPATVIPGAPVRLSAVGHGLTDGWPLVWVEGHSNFDDKQAHVVRVVDVDTLELPCLNGVKYKAGAATLRALVPVDMTGYAARMQIRSKVDGPVLFELTSDALPGEPRITLDNTAKTITREIHAALTEAIDWKAGVFDLEMVIGDTVTKIDAGKVTVDLEVTK